MVRIASIIMLALFPLLAIGNDDLRLTIDSQDIEIGKPLHTSITATNIDINLSSIDLSGLTENFGVRVVETAGKFDNSTGTTQELQLLLYPRQTGLVEIPSLGLGPYNTSASKITVKPARVIGGVLEFSSTADATTAWQRQQIVVTTTLITPSKFAKLELDDFIHDGLEVYKLTTSQKQLQNGLYQLTSGWVLYPLLRGEYSIALPAVNYRHSGKVQRKFFPPSLSLNIKKLPSYVPPLMPVGRLTINSIITSGSAVSGNSHTRLVRLSSNVVLPDTLALISLPFSENDNIKYGNINSSREITADEGVFSSNVNHQVPVRFTRSGLHSLPALTIRYFDPVTGKIATASDTEERIFVLKPWLKVVLSIISLFITFKLITVVFKNTRKWLALRKAERFVVESSLVANSPQQLHDILNSYANIHGWGSNMTLSHWLEEYNIHKAVAAESIIKNLSVASYASEDAKKETQHELNKQIHALLSA